jgi:hypothetical protein
LRIFTTPEKNPTASAGIEPVKMLSHAQEKSLDLHSAGHIDLVKKWLSVT